MLSHVLIAHKIDIDGQQPTVERVKARHDALTKNADPTIISLYNTLYHPADRHTMLFKEEADVAMTLHNIRADVSLIVVCPFIRGDGVGFHRIHDSVDRPPIYARWSTGPQAVHRPLIVGCLPAAPAVNMKGTRDVLWYQLQPSNRWGTPTFIDRLYGK